VTPSTANSLYVISISVTDDGAPSGRLPSSYFGSPVLLEDGLSFDRTLVEGPSSAVFRFYFSAQQCTECSNGTYQLAACQQGSDASCAACSPTSVDELGVITTQPGCQIACPASFLSAMLASFLMNQSNQSL
jgi:hypothetical protein